MILKLKSKRAKTMFTKEDYISYFEEIEEMLKKGLVIYTDLLNELGNNAIRNKLYVIASEDMDAFKFIKEEKEKFITK